MIDYLIVGCGLAGISFAETCYLNQKTFNVIDSFESSSSLVAGGLYNPVILKRFSQVWKATEQLNYCKPFYKEIENRLGVVVDHPLPLYRLFASVEEQNNWFQASDKPNLSPFLSTKLISEPIRWVESKFGFGEVTSTGYVDTELLLNAYREWLYENQWLVKSRFDYNALTFHQDCVEYQSVKYKNIVFADGFGLKSSPFFKDLPLDGTKGELLIIKAPLLDLKVILKSSVFILPIGNSLYKVGATYNWDDKTDIPTEEGKSELLDELKGIISCDFEIVNHVAGVRPTVNDRRPLVGKHPEHQKMWILNGLGTRGVMLGPWLAKELFDHIELEKPLDHQIDVNRFYKKHKK